MGKHQINFTIRGTAEIVADSEAEAIRQAEMKYHNEMNNMVGLTFGCEGNFTAGISYERCRFCSNLVQDGDGMRCRGKLNPASCNLFVDCRR